MKDRRFVEKRLTDEQAELAGQHWDKAMKIARIQAKKYHWLDLDWESAAAIGLCDAASRFEPERDLKFWTLAYRRISGAIIDMMRRERLKGFGRNCDYEGAPEVYSMDAERIDGTRGDTWRYTLHDLAPSGDMPTGWEEQSIDFVYGETRRLPKAPRMVIRLYYCHGLTMKQIGAKLGFNESRACQLHKQAIELLREAIHPESIAC